MLRSPLRRDIFQRGELPVCSTRTLILFLESNVSARRLSRIGKVFGTSHILKRSTTCANNLPVHWNGFSPHLIRRSSTPHTRILGKHHYYPGHTTLLSLVLAQAFHRQHSKPQQA